MNAMPDEPTDNEPNAPGLKQNKADGLSPGEILREGRLAHDYSVDDLCAQTKLSTKTVKALEDNDFESLSQPVFARGYYRQCAKVLDLDTERLMAAYNAWAGEPVAPRVDYRSVGGGAIPQDVTPGGGFRFRGLAILLLLAVVAIAVIVFVLPSSRMSGMLSGGDSTDQQNNQTTTLSLDSSDNNGADNGSSDKAFATDSSNSKQPGAGSTVPGVAGNNASAQVSSEASSGQALTGQQAGGRNVNQTLGIEPPNGANAGNQNAGAGDQSQSAPPAVPPNRLVLTFSKRSWVRVTDANGNRLASGIFEAGDKKEFSAKPPYKIRLGFAPGVKISIGGKPVDVAARNGGKSVADLTVDAPDENGASDQSADQ